MLAMLQRMDDRLGRMLGYNADGMVDTLGNDENSHRKATCDWIDSSLKGIVEKFDLVRNTQAEKEMGYIGSIYDAWDTNRTTEYFVYVMFEEENRIFSSEILRKDNPNIQAGYTSGNTIEELINSLNVILSGELKGE